MTEPRCHRCLAEALVEMAERIPRLDRGTLVKAALHIELRGGAVHLAVGNHGATACGRHLAPHLVCTRPEHVTCELCRGRMR
jgi:tRNA U54 and U55 pseudouridine synthase Pus10